MKRRTVRIDSGRCTGCGRCVEACAEGAIAMREGKAAVVDGNVCDGLGACLPACPADAISFVEEDDDLIPMAIPAQEAQWPIQIRLVPASAPFLNDSDILLAADCSAFIHGSFRKAYAEGRTLLIGCPKLDPRECWGKLAEIVVRNRVRSVTVVRMDIPCCSPLEKAAYEAVSSSGKRIPLKVIILRKDGSVVEGCQSDSFPVQVH
jgi:Fe-S-cluster-containing hydrogenase component 2